VTHEQRHAHFVGSVVQGPEHDDDPRVRALFDRARAASGFLLKDTPPAAIVDAVHEVAEGEPMLSPSVLAALSTIFASTLESRRSIIRISSIEELLQA
jgi:DNA-binding NarL/FixJ family response regulator